ncbi:MAG: threonylcarbamoyl-AMP synthase [Chloroflexi bacterium]|nr:MAG: threonylcarbamoyl-AMP synthase [Chloroflexota bacterium]
MTTSATSDRGAVAARIAAGGVVAIPTDTVYGLACDPADAAAVERVFSIKRRPAGLELVLLAADASALAELAVLDGFTHRLARAFWPGPLTLVVPAREPRARLAIPRAGTSIGIRVPAHDLCRRLLSDTGPLATTSANRHGEPECCTASEVLERLGDDLDAVLEGGPCAGQASTIIDCTSMPPRVLRTGPLGAAELRPYLGG